MLTILNCQSEDVKSYRRSKRDGGEADPMEVHHVVEIGV
jgi:hypothetical protein